MRVLDLFCGRFGWGRAFAARGHEVVGIDLVEPPEVPVGCTFVKADILQLRFNAQIGFYIIDGPVLGFFDFVCCSSPCEQFSVHGMKHFHPNPPYPEMGIRLFNYTRALCEASGAPYVMENVRPAQEFVGNAGMLCGPFALWGSGVPMLMPQGITKGIKIGSGQAMRGMTQDQKRAYRANHPWTQAGSKSKLRREFTALAATIPPELANCVADYAERILEPVSA